MSKVLAAVIILVLGICEYILFGVALYYFSEWEAYGYFPDLVMAFTIVALMGIITFVGALAYGEGFLKK